MNDRMMIHVESGCFVAIGVNGDHRRSFLTRMSHRTCALLAETVALALTKATLRV
jgi:hypothetical protein